MKKLFVSMVLGLMILVGGNNFASAEDVYVSTKGDCDWYLDTDSVRGWPEEFTCTVACRNNTEGTVTRSTVGYVTMNGIIMGKHQGEANVIVTPEGQPLHWAFYTKALRYLKHIAQ